MPEQGAHNDAENETNPKSGGDENGGLRRPKWLTDQVAALICISGATLLVALGGALLNGHPKPTLTAWGLIDISSFLFGGAFCFGMKVHRKKQLKHKMPIWLPKTIWIGITIVAWLLSAFAIWQEKPEPGLKSDQFPADAYKILAHLDTGVSNVGNAVNVIADNARVRHLSPGQLSKLVKTLIETPKVNVEIKAIVSDTEASQFGDELGNAFSAAGFSCSSTLVTGAPPNAYPKGVTVVDATTPPNPTLASSLREALRAAGVDINPDVSNSDADRGRVNIIIGPKLNYNQLAAPLFVPGTEFTHAQLETMFPFGYAVIYVGENKSLRYEVFKNGLLDWNLDWENLKVEPDIARGTVQWTLPSVTGTSVNVNINVGKVGSVNPLKKDGSIYPMGMIFENKPIPMTTTLSDNQRAPIFALGFRIAPISMRPKPVTHRNPN